MSWSKLIKKKINPLSLLYLHHLAKTLNPLGWKLAYSSCICTCCSSPGKSLLLSRLHMRRRFVSLHLSRPKGKEKYCYYQHCCIATINTNTQFRLSKNQQNNCFHWGWELKDQGDREQHICKFGFHKEKKIVSIRTQKNIMSTVVSVSPPQRCSVFLVS